MKVKYISDWETLAFEKDKVYDVMSIEKGWYRIMTELDDDYLFPPEAFEIVSDEAGVAGLREWHPDLATVS